MNNNNIKDNPRQNIEKNTIPKQFRGATRDTWNITEFTQECLQEMTANGCTLNKDLITDGRIHRYSSDSKQSKPDEWYSAFEFTKTDNFTGCTQTHLIVTYGSWTNSTKFVYYSWKNDSSYSREYISQLHQARKQNAQELDAKIQEERDQEAREAAEIWEKASLNAPDKNYLNYIHKKGVDPLVIRYCLNPSGYPSIIVPFKNNAGDIRALEYISLGSDKKKYARCFGSKKGCYHVVDNKEIKNGDPIMVAEGWATAVSIFMANGGIVCAVGGTNNIDNAIGNLRQAYPDSQITIAADREKGEAPARDASKKYGTKIVLPLFPKEKSIDPETGKPYTDFNDLYAACGIDEVRKQLSNTEAVKSYEDELKELAKGILTKTDPCEYFSIDLLPPILAAYVKNICETTDAHPLVVTASALSAISVFLNTNVLLPYGEYFQDLYPNLWFMTISKSGFFKSTALRRGGALAYEKKTEISQRIKLLKLELTQLDNDKDKDKKSDVEAHIRQLELTNPIVPDDITPEAFVQYLSDGYVGALFHNELGAFIEKAIENGLAKALTNWYDMERGYWKKTKTQGEFHIDLPFFSICGVSTVQWMQQSLLQEDNRDVHGGFFARFIIFLPPIKKSIPPGLPQKNKILCQESIRIKYDLENLVKQISEEIKNTQRIFTISPEAWEIFSDTEKKTGIHEILYEMVETNYNDQTKEILGSFLKRWSPQILKIAMIMELLHDQSSDQITPRAINAAVNIIFPAVKSTAMLFENVLGSSEIQRKCQKVIDYIAKRDGKVARSKLLKSEVISDGLAKNYDEILDLLIQRNDIEELPKTPRGEKPTGKTFYHLKTSDD